ncbi:MAG: gfo/Idh/MocA family oxidoreductase, partial [Clostridia bacterium]|nr:gfo/Idh/MocA family oxidoreductase [Clostridia bacterium]
MTPVKFGMIGTNFVSDWLADAVAAVDCATVNAIYSRTYEKGSAFAEAHNIPTVYTDMEEFLSSDID